MERSAGIALLVAAAFAGGCGGGNDDDDAAQGGAGSGDEPAGSHAEAGASGAAAGDSAAGMAGSAGSGAPAGSTGSNAGSSAPDYCVLEEGPGFADLQAPELVYTSPSVGGPSDMVMRDGVLYLWEGNAVVRVTLDGFASELVAQFDASMSTGGLTMNDTHAFVLVDGQVMRAPLDGMDATPELLLADVQGTVETIAGADAESVYVWHTQTGVVRAVPVAGGEPEEVFVDENAWNLWVRDGFVYAYLDDISVSKLTRTPIGGGDSELVAEQQDVASFAFESDTAVILGTGGGVYRATVGTTRMSAEQADVLMQSPNGFPSRAEIDSLLLDGDRIYWTSDAPSAGWVSADREQCAEVLRLNNPFERFVVADAYLYFTYDSDVYRIPVD